VVRGRDPEIELFESARRVWTESAGDIGVAALLLRAAAKWPQKSALQCPTRALTYHELLFYVLRVVADMRRRGVRKGERVVLYIANSLEFYAAYLAAWHIGAVAVPLNVYLHPREIAAILADAQPRCVITVAGMQHQLEGALQEAVCSTELVVLDQDFWLATYTAEAAEHLLVQYPVVKTAPTDTAVILYTSGSTGAPKGVMLSGRNVITNVLQTRARCEHMVGGDAHTEHFLAVLPLFHAFSQMAGLWLPLMLGARVTVVPKIERRALLQGLEQKPTIFFGFPALFGMLVMMRNAPIDSVKFFVSGADALPDKIRMAFSLVYGRKICNGYGLTEASPVVALDGFSEDAPTTVVGRPVIGVECQVRDELGRPVPFGTVGALWVRGDNVMQGYYQSPDLTAQVIQDGWMNTGDLVTMDASQTITIVGRAKDLIINKGFNIYPQEIENVLLRHPAVFKAAVVAKQESGDQIPVAFVAVRDGATVDAQMLTQLCKENLAAYKVPRVVTCLADLPMTSTGKVDKKNLVR